MFLKSKGHKSGRFLYACNLAHPYKIKNNMAESESLVSATSVALSGDLACLGSALLGGVSIVNGQLTCSDVNTDRMTVNEELVINPSTALTLATLNASSELSARTMVATDSMRATSLVLTGAEGTPSSIVQTGVMNNNILGNTIVQDLTIVGNLHLANEAQQSITVGPGDQLQMASGANIVQTPNAATQNTMVGTQFTGSITQTENDGVDSNVCNLYNVTANHLALPSGTFFSFGGTIIAGAAEITPQNVACLRNTTQNIGGALSALQNVTGKLTRIGDNTGIAVPSNVTSLPAPWSVYGSTYTSGNMTAAGDILTGTTSRSLNTSLSRMDASFALLENKTANQTRAGTNTAFNKTTPAATVDVGGTLAVSGASSFASTLSVTGASTFTGALTANGGITASSLKYGANVDVSTKISTLDASFAALDTRTALITRSGTNMGINKANPSLSLDVEGSAAVSGSFAVNGTVSTNSSLLCSGSAIFGGDVTSQSSVAAPVITAAGRNVGTSLTQIDTSFASVSTKMSTIDASFASTNTQVTLLANKTQNMTVTANNTSFAGVLTVDALFSTDNFTEVITKWNPTAQLTLSHAQRTDGKGINRMLFAKPGTSDGASIVTFDLAHEYPCVNYWQNSDIDRSVMVITNGDDGGYIEGDGIVINPGGNLYLDAGTYHNKAVLPTPSNRAHSANVVIQPNGGSVAIGKLMPDAGTLLDVGGTLQATTLSANGTNVGATLIAQGTRISAVETKTQNITATTGTTSLTGNLAISGDFTLGGQTPLAPIAKLWTDTELLSWVTFAAQSVMESATTPEAWTLVATLTIPPRNAHRLVLSIPLFLRCVINSYNSANPNSVTVNIGAVAASTTTAGVSISTLSRLSNTISNSVTSASNGSSGSETLHAGSVLITIDAPTVLTTTTVPIRMGVNWAPAYVGSGFTTRLQANVDQTQTRVSTWSAPAVSNVSSLQSYAAASLIQTTPLVVPSQAITAQRAVFSNLTSPHIAGYRMDGGSKSYVYTPVFASTSRLNPIDVDDAWLVMPGWRIDLYDAVEYSGYLSTCDNTSGIKPRVFLSTETVGMANRIASVKTYFLGSEVNIDYIS